MNDKTAPTAARYIEPGSRIDNYAVVRLLGEGGEGVVYLARDVVLGRSVALKVLRQNDENTTRGIEEARLVAKLDHPSIVRILHVRQQQGVWFVVMEYVDGGSLEQRVQRRGPFSPVQALGLIGSVSDALAQAHGLGVVHRDIKPHNLLMPRRGGIKLADFGLALQMPEAVRLPREGGHFVGTPLFMAPEAWQGEAPSPPGDIYGLGACFLYMLTGRPPFAAADIDALRAAHASSAPHVPSSVPASVARLVLACLAKSPADRPRAEELRASALDLLGRRGAPAQKASEPPRSARPLPLDGHEAADAAISSLPPLLACRDDLRRALSDAPPLVFLLADDPSLSAITTRSELNADGAFVSLWVDVPSADVSLGAQLLRKLGGGPGDDLVTLLSRDAEGASSRSVVRVGFEQAPSHRQWDDLEAVAALVARSGTTLLVQCPPQDRAAQEHLRQLVEGKSHEVRSSPPSGCELRALLEAWVSVASGQQVRWGADGLALAMRLLGDQALTFARLTRNALTLASLARMRVVTTWAVVGAVEHEQIIEAREAIAEGWHAAPRRWSPAEATVRLAGKGAPKA